MRASLRSSSCPGVEQRIPLCPSLLLCNFSLTISRAHYGRDIPWPQTREDQRQIIQYTVAIDAAISHLDLFEEMLPYVRQHLPTLRRLSPMPDITFILESGYFKWLCVAARACKRSDQDRFRAYSREIEASAPRILRESRSGRMMHEPDETVSPVAVKH